MRRAAGTLVLCAALTGCHSVVGGTAAPADHLGPLPGTTVAAKPVTVADMLLDAGEVAGIVGTATMVDHHEFTEPDTGAPVTQPSGCNIRIYPADSFAYTGWVTFAGRIEHGAEKQIVAQVVAGFKDDKNPGVELYAARSLWEGCTQPFTTNTDTAVSHWTPGEITKADDRVTAMTHKDNGQDCAHTFAAKGIHLAETVLCTDDGQTAQRAGALIDAILAKIPQ